MKITVSNGACNIYDFIKRNLPKGGIIKFSIEPVPDDLKTEKDTEQLVFEVL